MEGESGNGEIRSRFQEIYQVVKSEVLEDPAFEYDPVSRKWIEEMLDYNVTGGKMNRGLSVIHTLSLLKQLNHPTQLAQQDLFLASVLGWCIQWLVGCVLVLDDILDDSHARRGRPCWYRVPKVGMIAINDGILLWNQINRILRNHFRNKPYYLHLLELFNEVAFQTASGENLDLISTLQPDHFSNFTPQLHRRISRFKTAHGTFYLPFACALLMLGEKLDDYADVKEILLEMGIYFQAQDDYLDCFGDPEKIGKIGTDIQDYKCSWLVVKALEVCNEEQKTVLCENYGKAEPANVARVKSLYNDLNLQGIFADYEEEVYEKLRDDIEALASKEVQTVLKHYLATIYKRKK